MRESQFYTGVDNITNEYGANDPVAIAKAAKNTVFVWEYETVLQNPTLAKQIVARSTEGSVMDARFFTANSDGSFTSISNGKKIQKGFLAWYEANLGLYRLGLPLDDEYVIAGKGTATIQIFERGALVWDAARVYDNPPDVPAGDIYFAHINSGEVLKFLTPAPAVGGGPGAEGAPVPAAATPVEVSPAPAPEPAPVPAPAPQVGQLQAEITLLQGQLAVLRSALSGVRQVLDPISTADVQLADAMKKAGF